MIPAIRFLFGYWRLRRRPPIPAERLAELARTAAAHPDLEESVRRLGRLAYRSGIAVDGQVGRHESVDPRVALVTDAITTEVIRRVRIVRPDDDPSPLKDQLKDLRKHRYKRKEAAAFADELRSMAPTGDYVPKRRRRRRPCRRRPLTGTFRRLFKVRAEALADDAATAVQGGDPVVRSIRLLWLARRGHAEIERQLARGRGVNERLLIVTHGVYVEAMRQERYRRSRAGVAAAESSDPYEEQFAELQALDYDHEEAERFAARLAAGLRVDGH